VTTGSSFAYTGTSENKH